MPVFLSVIIQNYYTESIPYYTILDENMIAWSCLTWHDYNEIFSFNSNYYQMSEILEKNSWENFWILFQVILKISSKIKECDFRINSSASNIINCIL